MKISNFYDDLSITDVQEKAAPVGASLRVAVTKTSAQGKAAQSATPNLMSFSTDENSIWFNKKNYGAVVFKNLFGLSKGSSNEEIKTALGGNTYNDISQMIDRGILFLNINNKALQHVMIRVENAGSSEGDYLHIRAFSDSSNTAYIKIRHYDGSFNITQDPIRSNIVFRGDIVDELDAPLSDFPLSANMGKKLNDEKLPKSSVVNNLTTTDTSKALSAAQGKALNDKFNGNKININFSATSNSTDNTTIKGYMGNIDGATLVSKLTYGANLVDSSSEDWVITLQEVSTGKVSFTGIRFAGFNLYSKNISVTISGSNYTNMTVTQGSRIVPAINNTLTSTSTSEALSAAQGKALNDKISGLGNIYRVKGTKNTIEEVYDISASAKLGDVWNIKSAFTIGGSPYPANTNVVCIAEWSTSTTPQNNWDPLGGTVDLSAYLTSSSASSIYATKSQLNSHTTNKSNPHGVTKSQIGLGNVTNDAQVKKTDVVNYNLAVKIPSTSQVPSTEAFAKAANYAEMFPVSFDTIETGEKSIVSSSTTTAGGAIVWLSTMKKFAYKGTDGKYYNNWAISGSPNPALVNAGLVKQESNSPIPGKVYIHDSGVYFSTGTNLVLAASKDSTIIIE